MKKLILPLFFATILFTFSCKKDQLVNVTGTATGIIADYTTNAPIAGAVVSIVLDSVTTIKAKTNASGYYSLAEIPMGSHKMKVSIAGYATEVKTISVMQNAAVENTSKSSSSVISVAQDVVLYPKVGKVTGQITDANGKPVSGATVTTIYSVDSIYSATTDVNGVYTLSGLPVGPYMYILASSSDVSGSSISTKADKNKAVTVDIKITSNGLYLINQSYKVLDNDLVDTNSSNPIVLTFSKALDNTITTQKTASSSNGVVTLLEGGTTGKKILTTYVISGNTLTITLVDAPRLTRNTNYTLLYDVYASSTDEKSGTLTFATNGTSNSITSAPVITTSTEVTNSGGSANNASKILTFTSLATQSNSKGTINYTIYYRPKVTSNSSKNEFVAINTFTSSSLSTITTYGAGTSNVAHTLKNSMILTSGYFAGDQVYVVASVVGDDDVISTTTSNVITILVNP